MDQAQVRAVTDPLPRRYRAIAVVTAGCGLRQGEAFGLRVRDVDFLRRRVNVEQQVKLLGGRVTIDKPKGGKTRAVPLPDTVAVEVAEHLRRYPASGDDLVFTSREHKPVNRNHFNRYTWRPALDAARIERSRRNGMHALHHFYASVLIDAGESVRAVADYLGHADPGFTLRVYAHLFPPRRSGHARRWTACWSGTAPSASLAPRTMTVQVGDLDEVPALPPAGSTPIDQHDEWSEEGAPMGDHSAIEWTEAMWNPTTGCDKTSPGCDNCYALTLSKRLKAMGQAKYQNDGDPRTSGPGFGLTLHPDTLNVPRSWTSPRAIFVNSMSDLFHQDVPESYIRQVFEVIADTPQHQYQVLTKRSKRLATLGPKLGWPPNLWMGVSVETSKYRFRLDHLRRVDAAVRFVSAEPLLGPLGNLNLDGIHWLIAGGESGARARVMDEAWVLDLRDQCVTAGVPFFFKQWGGRTPKAGGRDLLGVTHDEMPDRTVALA